MLPRQRRHGLVRSRCEQPFQIGPGSGDVAAVACEQGALEQGGRVLGLTQQHAREIGRRARGLARLAEGRGPQHQGIAPVRVAGEQAGEILDGIGEAAEGSSGKGTINEQVSVVGTSSKAPRGGDHGAIVAIQGEPKPCRLAKQNRARIRWRFRVRPQRFQKLGCRFDLAGFDQCHGLAVSGGIAPAARPPASGLKQRLARGEQGKGKAAVVIELRCKDVGRRPKGLSRSR